MKFIDLLKLNRGGDSYQQAQKSFNEYLDESALHLWKPSDPILPYEVRVLIGVAVWVSYDLKLLDTLNDSLSNNPRMRNDLRVDVFNFDDCTSQGELEKFIPGLQIKSVFHSPVVGIWRRGIHRVSESGGVGRRSITELLFDTS